MRVDSILLCSSHCHGKKNKKNPHMSESHIRKKKSDLGHCCLWSERDLKILVLKSILVLTANSHTSSTPCFVHWNMNIILLLPHEMCFSPLLAMQLLYESTTHSFLTHTKSKKKNEERLRRLRLHSETTYDKDNQHKALKGQFTPN